MLEIRNYFELFLNTAKPVGSACIGEQQDATNVSRIIATFWSIHKSLHPYMVFNTSRHNENYLSYVYKMPKAITYRMSRCDEIMYKYFMYRNYVSMFRCSVVTIMYRILFQIMYRKKWRAIQNYICSVVIFVDTLETSNFCCIMQFKN